TLYPPLPLFLLLFYSSHRDHRDLHSFPTRRSSDLTGRQRKWPFAGSCRRYTKASSVPPRDASWRFSGQVSAWPSGVGTLEAFVRSEEHTSELQSRFDLVCRLLLEKKNNLTHRKDKY